MGSRLKPVDNKHSRSRGNNKPAAPTASHSNTHNKSPGTQAHKQHTHKIQPPSYATRKPLLHSRNLPKLITKQVAYRTEPGPEGPQMSRLCSQQRGSDLNSALNSGTQRCTKNGISQPQNTGAPAITIYSIRQAAAWCTGPSNKRDAIENQHSGDTCLWKRHCYPQRCYY